MAKAERKDASVPKSLEQRKKLDKPTFIKDERLTEIEGERITTLIQRQQSRHEKNKATLMEPALNK